MNSTGTATGSIQVDVEKFENNYFKILNLLLIILRTHIRNLNKDPDPEIHRIRIRVQRIKRTTAYFSFVLFCGGD